MIKFYDHRNIYGCFSNFSRHNVTIYGRTWRTSEHAFQAMKFSPHRPDLMDRVHQQPTPGKAAQVGRDTSLPLREDWDTCLDPVTWENFKQVFQPDDQVNRAGGPTEPLFARVKDMIMFEVVKAKFEQHPEIGRTLIGTGNEVIIEDAEHDPYWGWGASKVGQNKLGRILMAVRQQIR